MSPSRRVCLLVALILLALLTACAPKRTVRVEPAAGAAARAADGQYLVARGDTLYGIAFRHGLDYRELAARNGIAPPYTIYPGQRLRLAAPSPEAPRPAGPRKPAAPAAAPAARSVVGSAVAGKPAATSATPAQKPPAVPGASPRPPSAPPANAGALRWQWPADGQIIARYVAGDPTRQGIGIAGQGGDPVRAAADGVVVYSGAGLIGYGELVIVKHDDSWLSAYGHNRKRLVAEGDGVRGGQQIAELGRSGAARDMLHFEVRRNGKPVDPLGVLPRR